VAARDILRRQRECGDRSACDGIWLGGAVREIERGMIISQGCMRRDRVKGAVKSSAERVAQGLKSPLFKMW
jgi:hypothetical protein